MKSRARDPHAAEVRAALDAFRRVVQLLRVGARDSERRAGLSSAQLFALQQIAEHPGSSINDLAALTFTHQSSVSVVIQRLVARKLVARLPAGDDRRRQRLALTSKGRRILHNAPAALQERLIAAISSLARSDRLALTRALAGVGVAMAPKGAAARPPMLFEEGGARRRRKA